jgi:hypothetical protein
VRRNTSYNTMQAGFNCKLSSEMSCRPCSGKRGIYVLGFALHKSAFKDVLALTYGWPLPFNLSCGKTFSVEHALSCSTSGFPIIRHNKVRSLTAQSLSEVCHNVTTEPHLQPLTGESMCHWSAIMNDNTRLNVSMCGFWGGRFEKAFWMWGYSTLVSRLEKAIDQTASLLSILMSWCLF